VSELQLLIIKIYVLAGVVKFEFDSYKFKILTCMGKFQVLIPSKYGDHLRGRGFL
jgi:hypothetical protein